MLYILNFIVVFVNYFLKLERNIILERKINWLVVYFFVKVWFGFFEIV